MQKNETFIHDFSEKSSFFCLGASRDWMYTYKLWRNKAWQKNGYGGVLLAIRKDYVFEKLDIETNTESVFAKVTLDKSKTLIIGSVCRPPSSHTQYMEDLCTTIEGIGQRFKNAVIWIGGDLNLPDINWNRNTIDGNQNSTTINNRFLDAIQNCSLNFGCRRSSSYIGLREGLWHTGLLMNFWNANSIDMA